MVDVIRVAVLRLLLLLLLARVTAGHDEVTGPSDVDFLCRQEVTQRNTTVLLPEDKICVGIGWLYLSEASLSWRRLPCPSGVAPVAAAASRSEHLPEGQKVNREGV